MKKSITNNYIFIDVIIEVDKGGGVAMCVRSELTTPVSLSFETGTKTLITMVGCYRPHLPQKMPSNPYQIFCIIYMILNSSFEVFFFFLNWDWLSWTSELFKSCATH